MEQRPDLRDLMASVGFLLLQWGELEDIVGRAIVRLSGGDGRPATADWKRWADLQSRAYPLTESDVREIEAALAPVRELRNLVAHGIQGAAADYELHKEPALRCLKQGGGSVYPSLSEIQRAIRVIEGLKPRIDGLAPRPDA